MHFTYQHCEREDLHRTLVSHLLSILVLLEAWLDNENVKPNSNGIEKMDFPRKKN